VRGISADGTVTGPVSPTTYTTPADVNGLRNWQSIVDVLPFVTPLVDGDDDLVIQTANGDVDSTSQVYTSYQQQIAVNSPTLTVAPGSTSNVFGDSDGAGPQVAGNNESLYDIKIVDQEGRPVAGVDVYESTPAGAIINCPQSDFVDFSGANPSVSIAPAFARTGGTGSVSVTAGAGCAWTAVSNVSWITITGGASGSGDGAVSYSVGPYGGPPKRRTGTATIAGQTFRVTQTK
jgi:hypothetical protein